MRHSKNSYLKSYCLELSDNFKLKMIQNTKPIISNK